MDENLFAFDVFLSHSAKDKDTVREVAERLRMDGLRVWFDEWEIKLGHNIPAKIEEGLKRSRVLCIGKYGTASKRRQRRSKPRHIENREGFQSTIVDQRKLVAWKRTSWFGEAYVPRFNSDETG